MAIFVGTCWHSREHNGDHQEHNWTFSGALWNSIMGKFLSIIAASLAVTEQINNGPLTWLRGQMLNTSTQRHPWEQQSQGQFSPVIASCKHTIVFIHTTLTCSNIKSVGFQLVNYYTIMWKCTCTWYRVHMYTISSSNINIQKLTQSTWCTVVFLC